MQRLETQFGTRHPELEDYQPLSPHLNWLQSAFFRLHRRRPHSDSGLQPISYEEIVAYGEKVISLPSELLGLFIRVIEATDNAVLNDFYTRRKEP